MAGKLFWFLTDYAGGPLIGSGPLVLWAGFGAEKVGGWIVWLAKNSSVSGGAAGAHSAHNAGAGANGPRPCVGSLSKKSSKSWAFSFIRGKISSRW